MNKSRDLNSQQFTIYITLHLHFITLHFIKCKFYDKAFLDCVAFNSIQIKNFMKKYILCTAVRKDRFDK